VVEVQVMVLRPVFHICPDLFVAFGVHLMAPSRSIVFQNFLCTGRCSWGKLILSTTSTGVSVISHRRWVEDVRLLDGEHTGRRYGAPALPGSDRDATFGSSHGLGQVDFRQ
jgi:hypothetical protein